MEYDRKDIGYLITRVYKELQIVYSGNVGERVQ